MSKHIKTELLALKELILKYGVKIPETNKLKFERDIKLIFQDLDNTVDYDSLEQMKNLARTRLITLKRIYGDLEPKDKDSIKKKIDDDILRLSRLKINISTQKEEKKENDISAKNIEEYNDDKFFDEMNKIIKDLEAKQRDLSKQQEIDRSIAFNKEKVEEYRKLNDELHKKLYDMYKEKEMKEKEKTAKSNFNGDMVKNIISEIIKTNNMDNSALENFDFENFAKHANLENLEKTNPFSFMKNAPKDMDEKMNEFEKDLPNGEVLVKGEEEPSPEEKEKIRNLLKDEQNKRSDDFDIEGDKIFQKIKNDDTFNKLLEKKNIKVELTEEVLGKDSSELMKNRIVNYEKWKAENEIIRQEVDGEIRLDNYGSIEFKFYETDEEQDSEQSTGKETYVFRDGKMVKGKAKKRKTTTYSNWHSGNVDPDDMRKHRELLDRQHFGGPLWDGIKPRSVLNEVPIFPKINPENEVTRPEFDKDAEKKWGKKDFEEIVR